MKKEITILELTEKKPKRLNGVTWDTLQGIVTKRHEKE